MKNINRKDDNCITTFSKCVQWTGCDIPCLGIKNGDYLDDIIFTIVNKICILSAPLDLSTVNIQCLIDKLGVEEPSDRSLAIMLQIMVDSVCSLKDAIDAINAIINQQEPPLVLDLKCLTQYDPFGQPLPYTLSTVLQSLLNELCDLKDLTDYLSGVVVDLQNQINNLTLTPYEEPLLTSCLYVNKPTSQALNIFAGQYCSFADAVGNITKIQTNISKQCEDLNPIFQTNPDWTLSVNNLADSLGNMWVVTCDTYEKVNEILNTCCKVGCDDISIGWQTNDNEDGDGVTLDFGSQYGNKVPAGFTDCGSTVTFIDHNPDPLLRKTKTYTLPISNTFTSIEFDVSMLFLDLPITIKVCSKLCKDGEQCCNCVEADHLVVNGSCNVCDVTITGTTGSVLIEYTHNSFVTTITAVVGEVVYIPRDAINLSYYTITGDAVPDTTCLVIEAKTFRCFKIDWVVNNDAEKWGFPLTFSGVGLGGDPGTLTGVEGVATGLTGIPFPAGASVGTGGLGTMSANIAKRTNAWDEDFSNYIIKNIGIDGVVYNLNVNGLTNRAALITAINTTIPISKINEISVRKSTDATRVYAMTLIFKAATENVYLEFEVPNTTLPRFYAVEIEDCIDFPPAETPCEPAP